jgi:hypothetical protein
MASNTLPIVFDGTRYRMRGAYYEKVYGLLIFLDALGVKGIWETKDPAKVLENWNKVYEIFYDELYGRLTGVNLSAFSDTLIISMRGHEELIKQPWRFVEILCQAVIPAFVKSMDYDFFFRGVLSMGYFSQSVSSARMLIGPAVDEAANLYEAADWIGISLSPSTRWILENSVDDTGTRSNLAIIDYNIPKKTGTKLTWAVNWTEFDRSRRYWNILVGKAISYAQTKEYHKYIKYQNTLDFYRACIELQSSSRYL